MRGVVAFLLITTAMAASAQPNTASMQPNPIAVPTQLAPAWQQRARSLFERAVEIPTVAGRGQVPKLAEMIASELRAGGFAPNDIRILPHEGFGGEQTVSLIARWRSERPRHKPLLILGHMDVVEAIRSDWQRDPFEFIEEDGYFYGRGTLDNKSGVVAATMALLKLREGGFRPSRDIIVLFTGDEETAMNGARLASTEWSSLTDAEFVLNVDSSGGFYDRDGRPLGFGLETAEKTYQTYFLTVRNRGGHSSRPRRDNAIYELADALKRLEAHRFEPMLNETTRAYFSERAKREENSSLGQAIRRWLANPDDHEAADIVENSETEMGMTRTRCVATMLEGGHADNALPQMARATVNCRIMPGIEPKIVEAELSGIVGAGVEVAPDPSFAGVPTPVSPLRTDVVQAHTNAIRQLHGPDMPVIPQMMTGTSDSLWFRAAGIPAYGVAGDWGISPDDERAHGLDERIPVRAFYDNVLHIEFMLRDLAGDE